jgi:hypothetical protein
VGGLKGFCLNSGNFISFLSKLNNILALVPRCEFTKVTEIVTLHLHEEDLSLGVLRVGNKRII